MTELTSTEQGHAMPSLVLFSEDEPHPFVQLLARREAALRHVGENPLWTPERCSSFLANARERAVHECLRALEPAGRRATLFLHRYQEFNREDAFSESWLRMYQQIERIYEAPGRAPANWMAWVRRIVENECRDIGTKWRRGGIARIPADVQVTVYSIQVATDDASSESSEVLAAFVRARAELSVEEHAEIARRQYERFRALAAIETEARAYLLGDGAFSICAFHPGRHCEHAGVGAPPGICPNLDAAFEVIREVEETGQSVADVLSDYRERHELTTGATLVLGRDLGRCVDWLRFRAFHNIATPEEQQALELAVIARFPSDVTAQPSTFCVIGNLYPQLTLPDEYRSAHQTHLSRIQP